MPDRPGELPLPPDSRLSAKSRFSRRQFLRGMGVAGAGAVIADHPLLQAAEPDAPPSPQSPSSTTPAVALTINGRTYNLNVETRTTLLSALRDHLTPPITGPKLVCDVGTCGACTVILNGKPVYSCLVLAVDAVNQPITTAEGLGTPDHLSPVQQAFVDKDALMCGFCTPGFVTTISALLKQNPHPTDVEVKEACKGNFCRCGTYPRVIEAALAAAKAAPSA